MYGLSPFHINFVSLLLVIASLQPSVADQKKGVHRSAKSTRAITHHPASIDHSAASDGEESSICRMITNIDKPVVVRINPEILRLRKRRWEFPMEFKDNTHRWVIRDKLFSKPRNSSWWSQARVSIIIEVKSIRSSPRSASVRSPNYFHSRRVIRTWIRDVDKAQ